MARHERLIAAFAAAALVLTLALCIVSADEVSQTRPSQQPQWSPAQQEAVELIANADLPAEILRINRYYYIPR